VVRVTTFFFSGYKEREVANQIKSRRLQQGFSLIELMIVLVIIGLLCAIGIPELLDAKNKARQKASLAEVRNVGVALSAYMAERGVVPPTITPAGVPVSNIYSDLVPYATSVLHVQDSWQHDMTVFSADHVSYTVVSWGKDGPPPGGSAFVCITPSTAFIWNLDTALVDGIFLCSPS
jgi:general secretion pathway protein G